MSTGKQVEPYPMTVDEAIQWARDTRAAVEILQPTDTLNFYKTAHALSVLADEVDRLRLEYWRSTEGWSVLCCRHGVQLTSPCDECAEVFAAFQAYKSQ